MKQLIVLSLVSLALGQDYKHTSDEYDVWNREAGFASSVSQHDAGAFAALLHAGALFNAASDAPTRGAAAVAKNWAGIIEGKNIVLRWLPQYVSIGGDPNIAISRGPFTMENPNREGKGKFSIGYFTSVWVREAKGKPWLVLFDGGGAPPIPAENAEAAAKHMAQAPKVCPGRVSEK